MGVERTVTNLFHPNLTIFDENNILGCILADAEQLFLGLQLLAEELDQTQTYQGLFSLLDNEDNYSAARIRQEARRLMDTKPKE